MNARLSRSLRVAALLAATLAAGCAMVGPDYRRPDMALPGAFTPGSDSATAAVSGAWWRLYGDETLNELVASALARNADLQLAAARIEETDANLREIDAAFLPQLDLAGAASRSRVTTRGATPLPPGTAPVRNNVRITAQTAFELDFWGRLRRAVEAARATALGTRYARDVVTLSLAGLTAQAYFSLRSLDAQIAVTRESLASRAETLEVVRNRAAGGIASDLEVSQTEVAHADASALLKELHRQRHLVEHQLSTLTGRLDLTLPADDLMRLPIPPLPPPGLPSALLERRPDIAQAEQQMIAANAAIGVARAAMLPSISLTGSYGAESRALAMLLENGSRIWSLGFGLSLPIFDWGRLSARADAAEARERQSLANYQRAIESAFREVADALTNIQQTTASEKDVQVRATAARNALRLARLRYEAGYSGYLEVLDAQRTANEAALAVVRNRQTRLSASVDLMKALGGGWTKE